MKSETWGWITLLALLSVIGLSIVGWVMNIVEIINSSIITGMTIARVIGVFIAPLGAVLGYL